MQRVVEAQPRETDAGAEMASAVPEQSRSPRESSRSSRPRLTSREVDVIELATLGLTNGQIAQRLNLSTYAVKFHLSSAYGKLGVANRTQAAVAYLQLRGEGQI